MAPSSWGQWLGTSTLSKTSIWDGTKVSNVFLSSAPGTGKIVVLIIFTIFLLKYLFELFFVMLLS